MYSNLIVSIILVATVLSFLLYKRKMIVRLFSLDIAGQVEGFEKDIQKTADLAVDKMAEASEELAKLLQEAQETIEELQVRTKIAEEQLYKASLQDVGGKKKPENNKPSVNFAEQLIKASYQTAIHLDEEAKETKIPKPKKTKFTFATKGTQAESIASLADPQDALAGEDFLEQEVAAAESLQMDMRGAEPQFIQKQIMHLAANGYDDLAIAKALKLGIGEVKLTKNLLQK